MPPETFAPAAMGHALPASGWLSWAPEVTDAFDSQEADGPFQWLGAALSVAMWGCASLLAVWYL